MKLHNLFTVLFPVFVVDLSFFVVVVVVIVVVVVALYLFY